MGNDGLELVADGVTATMQRRGAWLRSLCVGGRELLVADTGTPLLYGCYPMVPWVGRLGEGRFEFDGAAHRMPINMGPHAIHGLGLDRDWTVTDDGALTLALEQPWPFGGTARVDTDLRADRLTITLSVTAGEVAMPAEIGWHPVIRKTIDSAAAELAFSPTQMWQRGPDGLPTGERVDVPTGPWDDCFAGVTTPPVITWSDGFSLMFESPTPTWVVYNETPHALCVEPQTGIPDAFNHDGCTVLQPGRTLSLPLTLRWG